VPEVVQELQARWSPRAAQKSRVDERARQEELVTPEAFEELQEAIKRGEIATTIGQALIGS
jgi:hypothetical protein